MTSEIARVAVTGRVWMGKGIGSIDTALREVFQSAKDEVVLTAYAISTPTDKIFGLITAALDRGVKVTAIVNRLSTQPRGVTKALNTLSRRYEHFVLRDFRHPDAQSDLHAKVVVADRQVALVGSSNLSRRGWLTNHELAVLVKGAGAREACKALDRLIADKNCCPA